MRSRLFETTYSTCYRNPLLSVFLCLDTVTAPIRWVVRSGTFLSESDSVRRSKMAVEASWSILINFIIEVNYSTLLVFADKLLPIRRFVTVS